MSFSSPPEVTKTEFPKANFTKKSVQSFFSYLLHEIASPVSSLLTGIDLLESDADHFDEIFDILKGSSQTLRDRLEYFRAAFGSGGTNLSPAQTQTLISRLWPEDRSASISFQTSEAAFSPGVGQSALLLLLWLAQKKKTDGSSRTLVYSGGKFMVHQEGRAHALEELQEVSSEDPNTLLGASPCAFIESVLALI